MNYEDVEQDLTENCETIVSDDDIYIKLPDAVSFIKELKVKKNETYQ